MKTRILYIFTRTPLHVGSGSSVGAIDQPIQRERHTGFPIIPGSSIKGVMRDHLRHNLSNGSEIEDAVFGSTPAQGSDEDAQAGAFSFSEAKLLAFPVRSAKGSYALATSPLALQRYARAAGLDLAIPAEIEDGECLSGLGVLIQRDQRKGVALEEYAFNWKGEFPEEWANHLSGLLDDAVLQGAKNRWVLLSDGDLSHFALNATEINQHVRINDKTGTAEQGGLFDEETVPSESLFFSSITDLPYPCDREAVVGYLGSENLIQFGGNATTGLGFCTVKLA